MTTLLASKTDTSPTWYDDGLLGPLLRYYVDQPAPRQWVAVGLLTQGSRPILLTASERSEDAALARLRERALECLAGARRSGATGNLPTASLLVAAER